MTRSDLSQRNKEKQKDHLYWPSGCCSLSPNKGLDELQVTCVVIGNLVPSEYIPKAANCPVAEMLGLAGVTAIETNVTASAAALLADELPVSDELPPPPPLQ